MHPHAIGNGLKLIEQLHSHPGVGTALIILCAAMPTERGGGDLELEAEDATYRAIAKRTIGRWAGDRIALVGDYAQDSDLPIGYEASTIYNRCAHYADEANEWPEAQRYKDISQDVAAVIEHELGGHYSGDVDSWRDWVPRGAKQPQRPAMVPDMIIGFRAPTDEEPSE